MASKIELVNNIERIDYLISGLRDQRRIELEELEEIEDKETP
jgi:hypothetical protein